MSGVTDLLKDFLNARVLPDSSAYSRLVLGGLPLKILEDLFSLLTGGDGSPWRPTETVEVPVFLVHRDPGSDSEGISRRCNWDYALAIRNSFSNFLLLVDPLVWDDRTYSIINATDTIGRPLPPIRRSVPSLRKWSEFYANLVEMTAERIGIESSIVEQALRESLKDLPHLDPTDQHLLPWKILERVVDLSASAPPSMNDIASVCGLLSFGTSNHNLRRNRATLERFARFLEGAGMHDGIEELKCTSRGSDLEDELDSMAVHLRNSAGSVSAIRRAPSFYYSRQDCEQAWWDALTVEVLEGMLSEVGHAPDAVSIRVECVEPLNPSPIRGEPFLVEEEATIQAVHPGGRFESLRILRALGRRDSTLLLSLAASQSPVTYSDGTIPAHDAPITYSVEAHGATSASVQVISLANYEPGGFITCLGVNTRKISKPRRSRVSVPWKQDLLLGNNGVNILRVFCSTGVHSVKIADPPEFRRSEAVKGGTADLHLDFDDDVEMTLELLGDNDELISTILLSVAIDQNVVETVPSQFYALVKAHQNLNNTTSVARCRESWLRVAENQLLNDDSSWLPILATPGWADSKPRLIATRQFGRLNPQVDPRPEFRPPDAFIEVRGRLIEALRVSRLPIPEVDLGDEDIESLAADYVQTYREWSEDTPAESCWIDTVSILEPEDEQYGGHAVAAFEPICVLVSPLHPIRLGWQVAAQRILKHGLDKPCPLAGLLDPHRCPEVFPLALTRSGGDPGWKSYISVACQDPMWGLYWDTSRLRDMQRHGVIWELISAGIVPRGMQSGFTASQARKTLEEVSHVLPTRSILRIGVVGSGQGSTSCTEGLIDWSRELYGDEGEILTGPQSIELYDSRLRDLQPSNEEISSLADDTGHRVRWHSAAGLEPTRDLVIVDHLGSTSPRPEIHDWKSPSTEGALIRSRVRLDRRNAELVVESRAGEMVRSENGLLDELSRAISRAENLAETHGGCSHVAFMPNRQVVSGELPATRFLAISSTEIDPACFARSTPQAGGFLWDYELPQATGPGEQRDGFYLLARPPEAIRRAVSRAARVLTQSSIDIDAMLVETSRRGIPILKRLAAGGSLARGELGMLLAVRLLQDSFRGEGRTVRLPAHEDGIIRMILPVDPYASPLSKMREGLARVHPALQAAHRPDLLVACIQIHNREGTRIRLVPLEVKFRDGPMPAAAKVGSLAQASNLGKILHHLLRATPLTKLWRICGLGFLSEILDHGFRVYGDPSVTGILPERWAEIHQKCLADIAADRVAISLVEEGRLLVFDESTCSYVDDIDNDGTVDTLVVCREDSRGLLDDGLPLSDCVEQVATLLQFCSDGTAGVDTDRKSDVVAAQPPDRSRESDAGDTQSVDDGAHDRATASESSVVPLNVRELVEEAFADFIGNQPAIDTLRRGVLKAMLSDPPQLSVSYLLTGNPSTGKTELARRVALALDLPFVSLDGRGLTSRERLFDLIDGTLQDTGQQATRVGTRYQLPEVEYPPLVVFVDEIHLVSKSIQESLLTALEPKDRSVLLMDRMAKLPQVTFLFATTRPSEVDMALRSRCTEVPLQDYTEEEVAAIVGLDHPEWPERLRRKIARYGRFVPRIALDFARELADEALVSEHQDRDLDGHLDEVRRTRLVDENGLSRIDIEYLELLDREGKPLGERNILTMLGNIDKDRFIEEVEPLLVSRMRLVRRSARGREITTEGRRYLIDMRRRTAETG